MILLAVLLYIVTLTADVYINWYLIEKKGIYPNHKVELSVRALFLIPDAFLFVTDWPLTLLVSLVIATSYFILYDGFLNLARKRNWFYIGLSSDSGEDALTDNLLEKIGPKKAFLLKIILFLMSLSLLALWL